MGWHQTLRIYVDVLRYDINHNSVLVFVMQPQEGARCSHLIVQGTSQ